MELTLCRVCKSLSPLSSFLLLHCKPDLTDLTLDIITKMDPQIRNFRDFLLLYNKLTETCFLHCTDNFFNRNISPEETNCVDKCVIKYSNVNQKVMGLYVEAQTAINNRRMAELEIQMKQQQEAQLAQQQQQQKSVNAVATGNLEGIGTNSMQVSS